MHQYFVLIQYLFNFVDEADQGLVCIFLLMFFTVLLLL